MEMQEKAFITIVRQYERVIYKVCSFYVSDGFPMADLYQEVVCKANKSLNRLLGWNVFDVLSMLVVIPFLVFLYNYWHGRSLFLDIFMIYAVLICCIVVIWYLFKIHGLMKIDLTTDFINNINRVNQYNIYVKRERIISQTIVGPIFLVLMFLTYVDLKAQFHQWVLLVSAVAFVTIYGYWAYKKLYKKNIDSIIKSLNEIRELKEE